MKSFLFEQSFIETLKNSGFKVNFYSNLVLPISLSKYKIELKNFFSNNCHLVMVCDRSKSKLSVTFTSTYFVFPTVIGTYSCAINKSGYFSKGTISYSKTILNEISKKKVPQNTLNTYFENFLFFSEIVKSIFGENLPCEEVISIDSKYSYIFDEILYHKDSSEEFLMDNENLDGILKKVVTLDIAESAATSIHSFYSSITNAEEFKKVLLTPIAESGCLVTSINIIEYGIEQKYKSFMLFYTRNAYTYFKFIFDSGDGTLKYLASARVNITTLKVDLFLTDVSLSDSNNFIKLLKAAFAEATSVIYSLPLLLVSNEDCAGNSKNEKGIYSITWDFKKILNTESEALLSISSSEAFIISAVDFDVDHYISLKEKNGKLVPSLSRFSCI